jgi:outer membrane protein TolC
LPSLTATAGYVVQKDRFSDTLSDRQKGWKFGVQADWSIFDSFATAGRVQQARAQTEVSRYALQQAELDLDVQVRRAYSALTEASELVIASQKVVTQAEESLRLAKARFAAGAAVQLDILDAQVALTESRTNEVQAIHDFNVSAARMQHALGEYGAEFN